MLIKSFFSRDHSIRIVHHVHLSPYLSSISCVWSRRMLKHRSEHMCEWHDRSTCVLWADNLVLNLCAVIGMQSHLDNVDHVHSSFKTMSVKRTSTDHGPLTRYVILWVAHAPGMPGNFFPAAAVWRSRHASRHVRHARAVMHVGIANYRFPLKSVAGKTFPAFPVHAQPAILCIW